MSNDILAVFAPYYTIPAGAIMRGESGGESGKDLKIEVSSDDVPPMKEKLVETKPDGTDVFRKAGETTKTSAKLKKEGKPKKKPKPKPEGGKGEMSAEWKEVYVIPAVDEEIPEDSILLINAATSDQMIHAIVPVDYTTEGTLLWETGMDPASAPDSNPPNRFAGWRA